jgi:hypothetical protein
VPLEQHLQGRQQRRRRENRKIQRRLFAHPPLVGVRAKESNINHQPLRL